MRSSLRPVLLLGALCVADWAWTLLHLARGIPEANPLLAVVFEAGGAIGFSIAKLGSAGLALPVLAWQRDHPFVRRLVPVAILAYGLVLGVHALVEIRV